MMIHYQKTGYCVADIQLRKTLDHQENLQFIFFWGGGGVGVRVGVQEQSDLQLWFATCNISGRRDMPLLCRSFVGIMKNVIKYYTSLV